MLKVWIAGSAGQIGTAINQVLDPMEMEVFNTDKMNSTSHRPMRCCALARSTVEHHH